MEEDKGEGPGTPTTLYRMYDDAGTLLYVGISGTTATRLSQHRAGKDWWHRVSFIRCEHFATRSDAAKAELRAIAAEQPEFNKTGAVAVPHPPTAEQYAAVLARYEEARREQERLEELKRQAQARREAEEAALRVEYAAFVHDWVAAGMPEFFRNEQMRDNPIFKGFLDHPVVLAVLAGQ